MAKRPKRNYPDLKTYFSESGDTMTAFAERYRRTIGWVSQVTHGKIEPSIRVALRISRDTGVPLESLASRPDIGAGPYRARSAVSSEAL